MLGIIIGAIYSLAADFLCMMLYETPEGAVSNVGRFLKIAHLPVPWFLDARYADKIAGTVFLIVGIGWMVETIARLGDYRGRNVPRPDVILETFDPYKLIVRVMNIGATAATKIKIGDHVRVFNSHRFGENPETRLSFKRINWINPGNTVDVEFDIDGINGGNDKDSFRTYMMMQFFQSEKMDMAITYENGHGQDFSSAYRVWVENDSGRVSPKFEEVYSGRYLSWLRANLLLARSKIQRWRVLGMVRAKGIYGRTPR